MINLKYIRLAARFWFGTMLVMALMLIFSVREAKAAPTTDTPPTQLDSADRGGPTGSGDINADDSKLNKEPNLIEMTRAIADKVEKNGGPYIIGRDEEVIDLGEKMLIADSHTVLVQAENGGGGMGVIEEFARQNPNDKVYRLNMDKISKIDPIKGAQAVKDAIFEIEKLNAESKGQMRHILVIDNLAGLLRDQFSGMAPIQSLREALARRANIYSVILTDATTAKAELMDGRFAILKQRLEFLNVKPPAYDMVVSYLIRNKALLEKNGITISTGAIENAARIAVRFRNNQSFKYAYQLLASATRGVEREMKSGVFEFDKIKTELNQVRKLRESLVSDIALETDAEEKTSLQKRLADVDARLADLGIRYDRKEESKDLSTPKRAKDLESKIARLEAELEAARDKKSGGTWFNSIFGSKNETTEIRPIGQVQAELERVTEDHARLVKGEVSAGPDGRPNGRVTVSNVIETASKNLNVSSSRLTRNFADGIARIDELKNEVFDQDEAIDTLKRALRVTAKNVQDGPTLKPEQWGPAMRGEIATSDGPPSAMLVGPTGSGKTETAIQLADKIGYELFIYDMSEFNQEHTISRLIGAPPGYKGMEEKGQLLADVDGSPESIVLFDEIEKAHPKVWDALLQILDKGRLSAANGGKATDFRRTIVLMTSNLIQEIGTWNQKQLIDELKKLGFNDAQIWKETNMELHALRSTLWVAKVKAEGRMRPELVERMKFVLPYKPITEETGIKIMEKMLKQFASRMKMNGVDVRFTPGAIQEAMYRFSSAGGGRAMKRSIMTLFRMPAADFLAENNLVGGDSLIIHYNENRQLEMIHTTETELAKAEVAAKAPAKTATGNTDLSETAEQQKTTARTRTKAAQSIEAARAATARLVETHFNKDWFVSEKTFRVLKRGK